MYIYIKNIAEYIVPILLPIMLYQLFDPEQHSCSIISLLRVPCSFAFFALE
jgi:hypothetical protein